MLAPGLDPVLELLPPLIIGVLAGEGKAVLGVVLPGTLLVLEVEGIAELDELELAALELEELEPTARELTPLFFVIDFMVLRLKVEPPVTSFTPLFMALWAALKATLKTFPPG